MKRKIISYNPKLKKQANSLRKNSTLSEVLLWLNLKKKQIKGYDFHRQKVVDNYTPPFGHPSREGTKPTPPSGHPSREGT